MATIKVTGLDKLQKALKKNVTMDDVKRVVRHNGSELQSKMQDNAEFSKGYQTGNLKRSIGIDIVDSGFTSEVGPGMKETGQSVEYAPYLEYGTRFMDAQPFVKPSYDSQKEKFKRDMQKLVR